MQHPKTRWSNTTIAILGAIACATIFALTIGLTFPLLSFVLQTQGYSDAAIGFSAAMTPLGVLVASPVYPRIIRRFGDWQVVAVCLVQRMILMMGSGQMRVPGSVSLQCSIGCVHHSETDQQLASTRSRRLPCNFVIYRVRFRAVDIGVTAGKLAFAIGSHAALALVVVLAVRRRHRCIANRPRPFSFLRLAPTLLVAIAVFAFWDGSAGLFPIYGMSFGMTASFASLALAVCILGNTLLQFPIGGWQI